MKKQPFICERRWCSFMLADLGIFINFLVLEKKKTCAALTVVSLPSSKKIKGNNPKNLTVLFIKLKCAKNRQDSLRVCTYYIYGKVHTERCASNKGKVEV